MSEAITRLDKLIAKWDRFIVLYEDAVRNGLHISALEILQREKADFVCIRKRLIELGEAQ